MFSSHKNISSQESKKEEKPFDAGPLWHWAEGISIEDFKHIQLDKESQKILDIAFDNNNKNTMEKQSFAIYGKIMKRDNAPSILHVKYQPTVEFNTPDTELKKLEDIFGNGKVLRPENKLTGIVHYATRTLWQIETHNKIKKIEEEFEKAKENKAEEEILKKIRNQLSNTKEFLFFLQSRPAYEIGLSAMTYFDNQTLTSCLKFKNRSTMNYSIFHLSELGEHVFYFDKRVLFNGSQCQGREYTLKFHLSRSAPEEILRLLCDETAKYLEKIGLPHHPQRCFYKKEEGYFAANEDWNTKIRKNKKIIKNALLDTIGIAADLKEGEPGDFWTDETDVDIIVNTMAAAKKNNIELDLNTLPPLLLEFNYHPANSFRDHIDVQNLRVLFLAARKNDINMVKFLVENGADIFFMKLNDVNDNKHLASYIKKDSEVEKYLMAIHNLLKAINTNEGEIVKDILKLGLIDMRKPIHRKDTVLSKAVFADPHILQVVVDYFAENNIDIDIPLFESDLTALQLAVMNNNSANARILLKAGAKSTLISEIMPPLLSEKASILSLKEPTLRELKDEKVNIYSKFFHLTTKKALHALLLHVVRGEQAPAEAIIKGNPRLLLESARATTFAGHNVKGTPFEVALSAEDDDMCQMILPYLDAIDPAARLTQYQTRFPLGYEWKEENPVYIAALQDVTQAIIDAKEEEILIEPCTSEKSRIDIKVSGKCQAAIAQFRCLLDSTPREGITTGPHSHIILFLRALTLYIEHFDKLGGSYNTPKATLYCIQVIGYTQRVLSACYLQAMAQGVIMVNDNPLKRSSLHSFFSHSVRAGLLGYEYSLDDTGYITWNNGSSAHGAKDLLSYIDSYVNKKRKILQGLCLPAQPMPDKRIP